MKTFGFIISWSSLECQDLPTLYVHGTAWHLQVSDENHFQTLVLGGLSVGSLPPLWEMQAGERRGGRVAKLGPLQQLPRPLRVQDNSHFPSEAAALHRCASKWDEA